MLVSYHFMAFIIPLTVISCFFYAGGSTVLASCQFMASIIPLTVTSCFLCRGQLSASIMSVHGFHYSSHCHILFFFLCRRQHGAVTSVHSLHPCLQLPVLVHRARERPNVQAERHQLHQLLQAAATVSVCLFHVGVHCYFVFFPCSTHR